jgi:hypothetical protein
MREKYEVFLSVAFCVLAALYLLIQLDILRRNKASNERAEAVAQKAEAASNLSDYLACKLSKPVCDNLYPDSAEAVRQAKARVEAEGASQIKSEFLHSY